MLPSLLVTLPLLVNRPAGLEIPFKVMESAIIADAVVNGNKVSCMFDTGFSGSFVLNESVNVGKVTGQMTLRDFVGEMQADTVNINSLQMGDLKIKSNGMMAVKMGNNNYSLSYGTHCDGIMGLEVFKDYPFEINFEKSKFIVKPEGYDISKEAADGKKRFLMRMLPKGNNSIELTVRTKDGGKMYLALDTGNGFYATTHKDVLERLGLWKVGEKPQFTKQSWVASGPVDSWSIFLKDMNIYGIPVPEAKFDIIDRPSSSADHDGTVGFGFLKNFNITVDMKKRMVLLDHFTDKTSDSLVGEVGMGAFYDEKVKRMRIYYVMPGSPAAKSGILRGDHLLGIDGVLIENVSTNRIETLLNGDAGTKVNVSTSRDGNLMRHELTREVMINHPL